MKISGVLHIGAHEGEERSAYLDSKVPNILWIEANPELASNLENLISQQPRSFKNEAVINVAVLDSDNEAIQFNITNNGQSSSLLEFGSHERDYPDIKIVKKIDVVTRRVDTLARQYPDLFRKLDFLTLDIQGVELSALKGFGLQLRNFKWIYTEINLREVYIGNGMIWEIDKYLLSFGFFRSETLFTYRGWGDAFYVKQSGKSAVAVFFYRVKLQLEYLFWALKYSRLMTFTRDKSRNLVKRLLNRG